MRYTFMLYDIDNSLREAILTDVIEARKSATLVGEDILTLTLSPYNKLGDASIGVEPVQFGDIPVIREKKYIRVYDTAGGGYESYLISNINADRQRGRLHIRIQAEQVKYSAQDRVVPILGSYVDISSSELLSQALSYVTDFTLYSSDIPTDELRTIEFKVYPTLLGLLNQIIELWSDSTTRYYYQITTGKVITISSEANLGEQKEFILTYEYNIDSIQRISDGRNMANRLYACSDDGNRLDYADSVKYKRDIVGTALSVGMSQTITLDAGGTDDNCVTNGSLLSIRISSVFVFNTPYTGYANMVYEISLLDADDNVIWGETQFTSSDAIATFYMILNDWVNIEAGDLGDIKKVKIECIALNTYGGASIYGAYIQLNEIWYELGPNIKYVENATYQTDYGEVEAPKSLDYPRVSNIFRTYTTDSGATYARDATFSGTYSGGVHEGWQLVNTSGLSSCMASTAKVKYGSKSQRVRIYHDDIFRTYEPVGGIIKSYPYFAIFSIYVSIGLIKIRIYDDNGNDLLVHQTTGRNWLEIKNEDAFGPEENTYLNIEFSTVSKISDFYIDGIQVAMGYEQMPFHKGVSADDMKLHAQSILNMNDYPRFTYRVNMLDYSLQYPNITKESFSVGDRIRVIDDAIPLNNWLRVIKIDQDLMNPRDMKLELSNRSEPLYNLVSKIADQKQLLIT